MHGFTLMELLVVLAIIAVLIALIVPAVGRVRESARKVQATNDIRQLLVAMELYVAEYQKLPLNDVQAAAASHPSFVADTVYGDRNGLYSSVDLCNILRAIPDDRFNQGNKLNPKETVFFTPIEAKNAAAPRNGIAQQDTTGPTAGTIIPKGAFVDPWGMEYVVFLDANGDGSLNAPIKGWFYQQENPDDLFSVNSRMEACSVGPDNQWGKAGNGLVAGSDDIVTWRWVRNP